MIATTASPRAAQLIHSAAVLVFFALAVSIGGSAAGAARSGGVQTPEREGFIAIDAAEVLIANVKIIDGTGAAPRDNQTVLIRDGRITAIGDAGTVRASADAEVVDGSGHTLIPGLVGLHNHSFYTAAGGYMAQLSTTAPIMYLASGVTTIRTKSWFFKAATERLEQDDVRNLQDTRLSEEPRARQQSA